jgi:hypothetical protein
MLVYTDDMVRIVVYPKHERIKEKGMERIILQDENGVQKILFTSKNFDVIVSDLNLHIYLTPDDPETPYFFQDEEARKVSIQQVLAYFKEALEYELNKARQRE